ncbi:ribonuclease P protein component [bacterium]|nr:ribonuclease P protein component [bacterium]
MPEKRDESFSKEHRLRKSTEFRRVFSRGKRTGTRYFVVYSLPNRLPLPRLGIQVKAKIGSAAKRNYIKRMVRETFRKMKTDFRQPVDLIFIAEKEILNLRCSEFEEEFRKVVSRHLR